MQRDRAAELKDARAYLTTLADTIEPIATTGSDNQLAKSLRIVLSALAEAAPGPMQLVPQRTGLDCESCCYAMLLGLAYEDVPNFYDMFKKNRRDIRDDWLAAKGLMRIGVDLRTKGAHYLPPNSPLLIAGVASPTGLEDGHAVIGRMVDRVYETVYDPSPLRDKSGKEPFDLTFIVPLSASPPLAPERAEDTKRLDWLDKQRNDEVNWSGNPKDDPELECCSWNIADRCYDIRTAIDQAMDAEDRAAIAAMQAKGGKS